MLRKTPYRWWIYLLALVLLALCLWAGWRDADPFVSQEAVRASIRIAPRRIVQILVQFVLPVLLLGFLLRGLVAGWRAHRR